MGFEAENITVMVDTNEDYTQPTGRNIKAHLKNMVDAAEDGDVLFVHFSGHGTQIPTDDPDEPDGKDECLCPCDMNLISDDDLTEIFAPLAEKDVKLTFVADCCHSGTLLDHEEVIITGPKDDARPPPQANAESMQSMLAELGADGDSRDIRNRSLPFEDFQEMLSERMGEEGLGVFDWQQMFALQKSALFRQHLHACLSIQAGIVIFGWQRMFAHQKSGILACFLCAFRHGSWSSLTVGMFDRNESKQCVSSTGMPAVHF
ncbi:caspase domain-containing protein [Dunaliella salina]|uniref:Caspase domain-containing protein n=1 Tax=Dunaliella salina TaxID=3046 RepID=A0ABQ7GNT8_DUNSA|nr:caspase domain-containing protein [Dunaliella salina]|eukprot:KAF5836279.1 caspase domain-containing protein [Dunaliella salina]